MIQGLPSSMRENPFKKFIDELDIDGRSGRIVGSIIVEYTDQPGDMTGRWRRIVEEIDSE